MPKKKTRTNNRITTRDAWKPRRRYSDTSESSNGSAIQEASLDYDYQYPVNDAILDDINISLAKSNIEGEEAHELLLNFLGNSAPSPVEQSSIVPYKNVEELETSYKIIYHFSVNVCKFPLEMTRLFKKWRAVEK